MTDTVFSTAAGVHVPAVTAAEMREVDRVATTDLGLGLLQMMEHAGRTLAWHARDHGRAPVVVVAGNGGNGGGGLACARHLANHDVAVRVVLDRDPGHLTDAAAAQYAILDKMDIPTTVSDLAQSDAPGVVVDALIGYGLTGRVREPARHLIQAINEAEAPVVALDVPSGVDATTGETLGASVVPDHTVTLALPKTGLGGIPGSLVLADIGIPWFVYKQVGIAYEYPYDGCPWVALA